MGGSVSLASRTVACIAALAAAAAAGSAGANPTGLEVVRGSASLGNPATGILEIHNSSGAILEWGGFSIGAGETTRFLQPSELSAVLNRVVGADPSALLGRLESNGRVFLINPHGIVFGPGAVVDTAGLVASSLGMSDADFIAGRLRFEGDASAGDVINHGVIKSAAGGHVILVAPKIANEGLIQADDGRLLLAAGTALGITSLDSPGVEYLVRAPDNEVLNVGRLLADGGAIDVFAGSLRHSGEIRADTVSRDALGRIRLDASADITLETGSRVSASGAPGGEHGGGEVRVVAGGALDLEAGAEVRVDGGVDGGDGGFLELSGHRDVRLVGSYSGRARKAGFANGSLLLDPTDIEIVAASVSTVGVSGLGFNDYLAASSPDGTRVYVSMRGGQNRVAVFDVGTNTVVTEIPLGGSNPGAIAVSPDGSTLYVLNESTDDISVIDTGTLAETATIAVGDEPRFVLFSADGTRAYVSTRGLSDSLYVIDTATDSVTDTVVLGNDPGHMAFSTDGATLYVANQAGNSLSVVDVTEPGPPGIIGGVLATVTEVGGGLDGAFTVVAHPDATRVYVSTAFPNNKVGVIDTATNTVASVITVGSAPYFMDLARDGRADPKLYVANLFGDSVSVIDTDTDTVATTITGLGGFVRVAVSADGLRAYVASEGASEVHVIDTFDDTVLRTFDGTDGVASAIAPVVTATGSRLVVPQFGDDNLFVIGAATDATGGDGTVGVGDPNSPSPPAPPDTLQIDPSSLAGAWSSVSLTAIQDIRVLDPIRGSDLGAGVARGVCGRQPAGRTGYSEPRAVRAK